MIPRPHESEDETPSIEGTSNDPLPLTPGAKVDEDVMLAVYEELRRQAERFLGGQAPAHTLQPTALVHEAFVRLQEQPAPLVFETRLHFFRIASRAMRGVLVNHAKAKGSLKRGGDRKRVTLIDVDSKSEDDALDLLALDEALKELETHKEDLARIVELRFFAGLSIEETARALEVSTATVERKWSLARAFLRRAMRDGDGGEA